MIVEAACCCNVVRSCDRCPLDRMMKGHFDSWLHREQESDERDRAIRTCPRRRDLARRSFA